jgi:Bacterial low temperature requirement A protein (LtrA)
VFWLAALAIGYFGPLLGGMSGWRVAPAHFVERHGLILIIALGESLVAIGLGARGRWNRQWRDRHSRAGVRGRDIVLVGVLRLLSDPRPADARGETRRSAHRAWRAMRTPTCISRWSRHRSLRTRDEDDARACRRRARHDPGARSLRRLGAVPARLCGVAPALVPDARPRPLRAVVFALLLPVALATPVVVALAIVAGVWIALHAYEIIWWREARARTRALRVPASAS